MSERTKLIVDALIFALIFGLLFAEFTVKALSRGFVRLVAIVKMTRTGLKALYPRTDELNSRTLTRLFHSAQRGDEFLLVARTNLHVLTDYRSLVERALAKGVTVKFLLLSRTALSDVEAARRIDLRALGLKDGRRKLLEDLGVAESWLGILRKQCEESQVPGRLEVYRTNVLIQNSVVMYIQRRTNRDTTSILYDITLGTSDKDRFVQYYKSRAGSSSGHFCASMRAFYEGMLEHESCSFAYDLSYGPHAGGPRGFAEETAERRVRKLLHQHSARESVRHNALAQLAPSAPSIFKAITGDGPLPGPMSAQIEITNRCSTRCEHCLRWSADDESEMDSDVAFRLLTELHSLGTKTITLSGGEPTQHPDFSGILEHAKSTGLAVGILSNGVGIKRDVLRSILTHADWLRLSIDGSAPAVYKGVRRAIGPEGRLPTVDAFADVVEVIKSFETSTKRPVHCKLAICYTIQERNVEDVAGMIRWVQSLDLPDRDAHLTFKFAHGEGGRFLCTLRQLRKLDEDVLSNPTFKDSANIPYLRSILREQSNFHDIASGRPTEDLYLRQPTRCFTPYTFALIDALGDVYPCCFLYEDNNSYDAASTKKRKSHHLGRFTRDVTFSEIWKGPAYRNIRDELARINPTVEKYSRCGECSRHCNQNRSLSLLEVEYGGLLKAQGDSDGVLKRLVPAHDEVTWL